MNEVELPLKEGVRYHHRLVTGMCLLRVPQHGVPTCAKKDTGMWLCRHSRWVTA
jgi:hypothetical protein